MKINSLTCWLPAPDAEHLVAALRAIAGTDRQPLWVPMTGTAGPGRLCRINLPPHGAAFIEVVESPSHTAVPEQLALFTTDAGAVVARLLAAGIDVDPPTKGDDAMWGSVLVGGIRILVFEAG